MAEDNKKNPEDLKELGNEAFAARDYREAIRFYTEAIKLDSSNHVFFSNRSASYGGIRNWKSAATDAKECIRLNPTFIKGYYRLSTAQIELEEYDGALATIRQGLGLDANNAQLLKQQRAVKQLKKAAASSSPSSNQSTPNTSSVNSIARPVSQLDDGSRRELLDLQGQYSQTTREYGLVQANLVKTQREHKVNEITKDELDDLPPDVTCYRSIGKIFLKSTKKRVLSHLETQMDEQKKKEVDMTRNMEYLERRMQSQRQNIEELVSSG